MPPPPALPTFWEFEALPDWTVVDFISDLHLSIDTPRTFELWAGYMRSTPASAVVILGDLFEVWVGDDARHSGFEADCVEVLADAAAKEGVDLHWGMPVRLIEADSDTATLHFDAAHAVHADLVVLACGARSALKILARR